MFTYKANIKDCVSNRTGMSDDKERACRVVQTLIIFNYMWLLALSHCHLTFPIKFCSATPPNNDTIIIIVVNINIITLLLLFYFL